MKSLIQGTPYLIQFAKNGEYENAWKMRLTEKPPTRKEIINYLNDEEIETLAVEYFWHGEIKETDEVITVLYSESLQVNEERFITLSLQAFYESLSFNELVSFIDREIIGFPVLFKIPMDFARVGIVDYWFSEGPIDIWQKGEEIKEEYLDKKLSTNPKVLVSKKNYQAMAGIFNFKKTDLGPYHILHSVCTKKTDKGWKLDKQKLLSDLKKFTEEFS